jgi:Domain of unknown function (DUF1887)
MLNAKVHVLLVSAQAAPNLLPTLDPDIKPREAILLVSKKMNSRADALEDVLREAQVKTSRIALDDEHDFSRLEEVLLDVAAQREKDSLALNVTGGTKLMALAAQSVASEAGWEVFYVDVDTDEIILLRRPPQRKKLAAILRLNHYLRGYGYHIEAGARPPAYDRKYDDLLRTLIIQVGSLEEPLGWLNALAQDAEDKRQLDFRLSPQQLDSRKFDALIRNFEEAGVLQVEGDKLRFAGESELAFAKGGWLEHHVFRTVCVLSEELGIRDKAANLVVVDDMGVKNELDVAFIARNRLFVIECKTARMDKGRAAKANDTLFKLSEICRRVGGLGTRGLLASYRQLGDPERRLAKALNIEVACGAELSRLNERLKRWVTP